MMLDHRWQPFHKVRTELSWITIPLQYLVDAPVRVAANATSFVTSRHKLLKENAHLQAQQLLLQAELQKFLALQRENAQLKALLNSSSRINNKSIVASLLAVDLAPFVQQVIINKGKQDGVYVGQPVVDAYGVMGQVIEVNPLTSSVLLITDSRSAVPVEDNRNGVRGIVVGLGFGGGLSLIDMPDTVDVQPGDLLVTSGLGQHFTEGYPVGVIQSVQHRSDQSFMDIKVQPSAEVYRSRQVLLIWTKQ